MARSRQEENQPAFGHAPGPESLGAPGELLDERVTLVMVEFDREERATAPSREVTPVVAEFEEEPESAAPSLSALALLQRMLGPEEPSEEFSAEEVAEAEVGSPSNVLALTMLFQPDPLPPDGAAAADLSAAEGDVDEEQASDELSFAAAVRVGGAAPVEGVRERAAAEAVSGSPGGADGAGSGVASDGTGGGDATSEGRVGRDGVFATDGMVGEPAEDGFVGTKAVEAVEGGGVPAAEVHEDVAVEEDTTQMAETANDMPALE
ncbi:MAG TPA: hypothetical protein PKY30_16915, partial [Myxococcota bacterium]|nr:hypothetical protein [Myxococcota bacterium]